MADFTCPEGHASTAGDYCDVCGSPIAAAGAATDAGSGAAPAPAAGAAADAGLTLDPPPLPPPAAATERTCPDCQTRNVADALFCESCGYDFTTGQSARPLVPPAGVPQQAGGPDQPADLAAGSPGSATADEVAPWVVEIWIDPDWYSGQDVPDACPSPGMPQVLVLRQRSVLVGRRSVSRGITPEVDLTSDSGVSRRHAQLSSDGQRWWVEDLQSANGTYLGTNGAGLPTEPIEVGRKVELGADGKIYVGGWTRLVVRAAEPGDLIS